MHRDKILIIRNSALGDVAMTLPVLYSVASTYPDTDFYLLTRPFFAEIFINRPENLHIIEADYKTRYKGIKGLSRLLKELHKYRFKAVADLHNVLRSWTIDADMCLRGVKVAVVDKQRHKRLSKNARTDQPNFIDRYTDVFRRLGYPVKLSFKSIYDKTPVCSECTIAHPAVGIAPFARYTNKAYPSEKMRQVIDALTEQGIHIYLFGAKGAEAETLDTWASEYPHCQSLAGKMPIAEELSAMANMDVMVTMDSSNQHLASIVGTPVVSIWGSTTPACGFYGYNQSRDNAVCLNIDCQPCTVAGSKTCEKGSLACLKQIEPAAVVNKVKRLLSSHQPTQS